MKTLLLLLLLSLAVHAEEVTFPAGEDTVYATFLAGRPKAPAVLLLSGSGPTDRDGNTPLLKGRIDSQQHLAQMLQAAGVTTLRYDKLFSGRTGMGSHAGNATSVSFDLYVDEAQAGYRYLASRPEVDPHKMFVLGHSEGGLIALVLAARRKPEGLRGLILASPMAEPYLQTLRDQVAGQYAQAVKAGAATQPEADAQLEALDQVILELRSTGAAPSRERLIPALRALFNPGNDRFLHSASVYDAAELAAQLELPILVLSGLKDMQISQAMIAHLMTGVRHGQLVKLPNVNHVLREVKGPASPADYTNPACPFSAQADEAIRTFVRDPR